MLRLRIRVPRTTAAMRKRRYGQASRLRSSPLVSALLAFGLSIGTNVFSQLGTAIAQSTRAGLGGAEQAIITLTNRERVQRKLRPLKPDKACAQAIAGHVNDMAAGRYLSHQGRDGSGASERYRRYNPKGRGAGENVAYNTYGTATSFVRQWLRSSTHRANILNPMYRGIGVSVRASCSGRRCYYYAGQCFSP